MIRLINFILSLNVWQATNDDMWQCPVEICYVLVYILAFGHTWLVNNEHIIGLHNPSIPRNSLHGKKKSSCEIVIKSIALLIDLLHETVTQTFHSQLIDDVK